MKIVFFNDYIGRTAAILMGLALILVCYAIQIATRKYIPLIYWIAVTAVAIFGTMSADFLNKNLGMSLTESTLLLLVLQAAVFFAWWRTEGRPGHDRTFTPNPHQHHSRCGC